MNTWLQRIVADSHARLLALPPSHPARQLLLTRGADDGFLVRYQIGWLPDPHGITACTPEFWTWVQRYGWDKIVFPLTDPLGAVSGLELRSPTEKGYRDFVAVPSDICPPTFGLHVALPAAFRSRRMVLVEGVFDYVAVVRYAPDVVAMLTSTATTTLRRWIARYATLVVCLTDMDAAGRRGAYKLAGLPLPPALQRPRDITTRALKLPPFTVVFPDYSAHDPSDLLQAGRWAELKRIATTGVLGGLTQDLHGLHTSGISVDR